ncbi:MAG: Fe-S cluster assembly scaffold protein NifU [Desulfobacterales bacterium]|nr:Fe-S cluster assembly scaffold protein NifU [Desulfobacterales bacterium]
MYSEKVMDHFSNPRNVGAIEGADGIGEVGNPVCGDMMTFYIKVKDDKLTDVKYKTFGCVAAIAVSSKVSEMTKGKTLEEAKAISKKAVAEALDGLPKEKMHCSNLGAQALSEAIKDYEERKNGKQKSATKTTKRGKSKKHITCSQCNAQNPVTAKFCMACGEGVK